MSLWACKAQIYSSDWRATALTGGSLLTEAMAA
jgi:hypothetical protein